MIDLVPASDIDYTDPEEVCAYRHLLCKLYECGGGFDLPAKASPLTLAVRRQAEVWLREVKSLIASILESPIPNSSLLIPNSSLQIPNSSLQIPNSSFLTPNSKDIPSLLSGYDMMHRIAHAAPCHAYIREVTLLTADRWLRGDKSISGTDVVLLLLAETDRDIRSLPARFVRYPIRIMTSWVNELMKHGTFPGTHPAETYRRLAYLLTADLRAHMTKDQETQAKAQWAGRHILTEGQIDALDTDTLRAYARFISSIPFSSSGPFICPNTLSSPMQFCSQQEYERGNSMYMHILSKIAQRPDTHQYAAKAIALTSKRHAALTA